MHQVHQVERYVDDSRGHSPRASRSRRCIVTRSVHDTGDMIRFVLSPDGVVVPDLQEKLPGRGCWVQARFDSLEVAVRKGLFQRAFKSAAHTGDDLPVRVDAGLCRAAMGALGLARKAGIVILGEGRVDESARLTSLSCVLHATDGAANGLKKVRAALTVSGQIERIALIRQFSSTQLGLALGLPNVIHAALPDTRAGVACTEKILKLARFRGMGAS